MQSSKRKNSASTTWNVSSTTSSKISTNFHRTRLRVLALLFAINPTQKTNIVTIEEQLQVRSLQGYNTLKVFFTIFSSCVKFSPLCTPLLSWSKTFTLKIRITVSTKTFTWPVCNCNHGTCAVNFSMVPYSNDNDKFWLNPHVFFLKAWYKVARQVKKAAAKRGTYQNNLTKLDSCISPSKRPNC